MGKVKDLSYELSLVNSNSAQVSTDLINGFLECIFVRSSSGVKIEIVSELFENIIFFTQNFHGRKLFNLRTLILDEGGDMFNYGSARFCLNEKLLIKVSGGKGSSVEIVLRYCS